MLYSYKVGVLRRLVPCLKCMELACQVLLGHFDPVFSLLVSKKGDECPVRDIKNRILQFSNCPILEFKVLQNAFKIKKARLKIFLSNK